MVGQEDCLRLSIYTPDLPVTHNQAKLPVFVWLFGKLKMDVFVFIEMHIFPLKMIPSLIYDT